MATPQDQDMGLTRDHLAVAMVGAVTISPLLAATRMAMEAPLLHAMQLAEEGDMAEEPPTVTGASDLPLSIEAMFRQSGIVLPQVVMLIVILRIAGAPVTRPIHALFPPVETTHEGAQCRGISAPPVVQARYPETWASAHQTHVTSPARAL